MKKFSEIRLVRGLNVGNHLGSIQWKILIMRWKYGGIIQVANQLDKNECLACGKNLPGMDLPRSIWCRRNRELELVRDVIQPLFLS